MKKKTIDKHFIPFATTANNRAILTITDTRTMQKQSFEFGYDGKKPYFVEETETEVEEQPEEKKEDK